MQGRVVECTNFAAEAFAQMARLRRGDRFTDVSIHCGEQSFSAHRVVLAASSAYLDRVLARTAKTSQLIGHTVIILKDASPDILRLVMEFMYAGKATVPADKFEEFTTVAKNLELRGLNSSLAPAASMPQLSARTEKATVVTSNVPVMKPTPVRTAIFAPPAKRLGSAEVLQTPPKKPSPAAMSVMNVPPEPVKLQEVEVMESHQAPLAFPELLEIPFADEDRKSEASSDVSGGSEKKPESGKSTVRVIPIVLIPEAVKPEKSTAEKNEEQVNGNQDVFMIDVNYPKDSVNNIPPSVAKKTLERVTDRIWCGWLEKNGVYDGTIYFCSLCGYRNPLMCNARRHERIHDDENVIPDRSLSPQAMFEAAIRNQQLVFGNSVVGKSTRVTAL